MAENITTITIDSTGKILTIDGERFDPKEGLPDDKDYVYLGVSVSVTRGMAPECPTGKTLMCQIIRGQKVCSCVPTSSDQAR